MVFFFIVGGMWIQKETIVNICAHLKLREIARSHITRRVGSGEPIFFWHDSWTSYAPLPSYWPKGESTFLPLAPTASFRSSWLRGIGVGQDV